MNNKFKKLIIVFCTFLFVVFLLNIFIKGIEKKQSDITNINILNYIPNDYELTILSNSTNDNIKKYINKNISENKRDELNIIKESIISYLGFNLKEKIGNIYDNEFALTFFRNKSNKIDILIIFKLKENKNINDILNLGEEFNKSEQIIEFKRLGKLNYITHIFQTKDNYIIASSNKKLIDSSLQLNNTDNILSKDLIPDDINLEEIKLISIAKYIDKKNNLNSEQTTFNKVITIINSEDNKIKLRSFSPYINKSNTKTFNNQIEDVKDIIFTNKYSTLRQNINFLHNNINQKEYLEEISEELNEELLFITTNNNWVLSFNNKLPHKISEDQFNLLKNYKKEDFYINNKNYSVYTNDRIKIKDNNIIYKKENPIFSLKDERETYISNNFEALYTITEKSTLSNLYLNHNQEIREQNYILNDAFFINHINNMQLFSYNKSLKNLQYVINTELFSLEDINISISQAIPERYQKLYLESNLKIL